VAVSAWPLPAGATQPHGDRPRRLYQALRSPLEAAG